MAPSDRPCPHCPSALRCCRELGLALRRRRGELPEELKRAGNLGERHVGALISLAIAGPATVSELAERMDMSLAHASLVVGELAGVGLVDRNHDEHDRRRIIVSLADGASARRRPDA